MDYIDCDENDLGVFMSFDDYENDEQLISNLLPDIDKRMEDFNRLMHIKDAVVFCEDIIEPY